MATKKNNKHVSVPTESAWTRVWLKPGAADCVHYWIGTGERRDGRERFVCRWCGAEVADPVEPAPAPPENPPTITARRGQVICRACGEAVHHTRTADVPSAGGRVCIRCLLESIC
jgi:hypothetical protein